MSEGDADSGSGAEADSHAGDVAAVATSIPAPTGAADDRRAGAAELRGTPPPADDKWNRWTAIASVVSAMMAVGAALITVVIGYETATALRDQNAVQLLAGFGTAEASEASQVLATAELDETAYLDGGPAEFTRFESAIAPLKVQMLAVAACMDSGLCNADGPVAKIFCMRAPAYDKAVGAVYDRTVKVSAPQRAEFYARARTLCPGDAT